MSAQLDLFAWTPPAPPSAIVLRRVDPTRNMARFYRLDVQPDLFGGWSLIREWGRIGQSGHVRVVAFRSAGEACDALRRQNRAKERRGYLPCPAAAWL